MINETLKEIQNELKAPKGQRNTFGNYNYRSCEDILEAVKPICAKHNATITLNDDIVFVGTRYYIKATATLRVGDETISVNAFAREEETKKGMDASQITGSTSSYARKYALNGLFAIDDTKDADTNERKIEETNRPVLSSNMKATTQQLQELVSLGIDMAKAVNYFGKPTNEWTYDEVAQLIKDAKAKKGIK